MYLELELYVFSLLHYYMISEGLDVID